MGAMETDIQIDLQTDRPGDIPSYKNWDPGVFKKGTTQWNKNDEIKA